MDYLIARVKTLKELREEHEEPSSFSVFWEPEALHKKVIDEIGEIVKITHVSYNGNTVKVKGSKNTYASFLFEITTPVEIAQWRMENETG